MRVSLILLLVGMILGVLLTRCHASDLDPKSTICAPLNQIARSCLTVRSYVKLHGKIEAERRARLCGATDADIAQAAQCLDGEEK